MNQNLSNFIKVSRGINRQSSGSTAVGNIVDMAGFEGCVFIAVGSSLTEGSTNVTLRARASTASGGTYVSIAGSDCESTGMATGSFNSKMLVLDVYKPTKRYLRPVVAGASSDVMHTRAIVAIQYGPRRPGSSGVGAASTFVAASKIVVGATS